MKTVTYLIITLAVASLFDSSLVMPFIN